MLCHSLANPPTLPFSFWKTTGQPYCPQGVWEVRKLCHSLANLAYFTLLSKDYRLTLSFCRSLWSQKKISTCLSTLPASLSFQKVTGQSHYTTGVCGSSKISHLFTDPSYITPSQLLFGYIANKVKERDDVFNALDHYSEKWKTKWSMIKYHTVKKSMDSDATRNAWLLH